MNIEVKIAPDVVSRHPDVQLGGFVADLSGLTSLPTADLQQEAVEALRARGLKTEALSTEPHIEPWRAAIAACGLKPSTYKSSPEQLARRLLKGGTLATPIDVVTCYCLVSAKHLAPLGAYDVDRFGALTIELRFGDPSADVFRPLGAAGDETPINEKVVVYAIGSRVMCWAWNHRDSADTCLRPNTRTALFLGESLTEVQHAARTAAISDLRGLLDAHGAGVGDASFADAEAPFMALEL